MTEVPIRPTEKRNRCIEARYHRIKLEKKQKVDDNKIRVEAISSPDVAAYSIIAAASSKKAPQNRISNAKTVTGFFRATANHPIGSSQEGGGQIAGQSRNPFPSAPAIGRVSPGSSRRARRIGADASNLRPIITRTLYRSSIHPRSSNETGCPLRANSSMGWW